MGRKAPKDFILGGYLLTHLPQQVQAGLAVKGRAAACETLDSVGVANPSKSPKKLVLNSAEGGDLIYIAQVTPHAHQNERRYGLRTRLRQCAPTWTHEKQPHS